MFWWAGVAMPIVTVVVILYARAQLKVIANQAQATLLLGLVGKWNSDKMYESIQAWVEIKTQAKIYVFSRNPGLADKEIMKKLKEHFKEIMDELQNNDYKKYSTMMRMLDFFEIVGQLVKRRYILLTDIDGLFRGPILDAGIACVSHINDRQHERALVAGLYENALFLISKIEEIRPQ